MSFQRWLWCWSYIISYEVAEGLPLQLFVLTAMSPLFLLQLNFHFHMIQNRMRITSQPVHLQLVFVPFAFHVRFQCRLSHVWNIDHSIAAFAQRLFPVSFKVARSDFWVTIPFNFERQEQHLYQSNRKSTVSGLLEKDDSFKWSTFHQDLSYHSNEMTPCPILHKTE